MLGGWKAHPWMWPVRGAPGVNAPGAPRARTDKSSPNRASRAGQSLPGETSGVPPDGAGQSQLSLAECSAGHCGDKQRQTGRCCPACIPELKEGTASPLSTPPSPVGTRSDDRARWGPPAGAGGNAPLMRTQPASRNRGMRGGRSGGERVAEAQSSAGRTGWGQHPGARRQEDATEGNRVRGWSRQSHDHLGPDRGAGRGASLPGGKGEGHVHADHASMPDAGHADHMVLAVGDISLKNNDNFCAFLRIFPPFGYSRRHPGAESRHIPLKNNDNFCSFLETILLRIRGGVL